MTVPPVLERWFEIIASGGSGDVEELLADDAVFYSPAVFTPQRGRAQAAAYLRAAEKLFAGANFRYVGKWFDAHSAVLEFAAEIDARSASAVVRGDDDPVGLTAAEVALVHWARSVATMPSSTTAADVDELRETGWSDDQIFAITVFSALRMAFSTVNDALGADPDPDLAGTTPLALQEVLSFGRHLG